jgi:Protein of Unknown function (DUF2784)
VTDVGLHLANYFFYAFHAVLILFNLLGWLYKKTRKLNLITLLITFASWLLLGIWKGWGYCFLTDWHYSVLRQLGEHELPASYIAFLVQKTTGWLPNASLVNMLTLWLAVLALGCSLWVNLRSKK